MSKKIKKIINEWTKKEKLNEGGKEVQRRYGWRVFQSLDMYLSHVERAIRESDQQKALELIQKLHIVLGEMNDEMQLDPHGDDAETAWEQHEGKPLTVKKSWFPSKPALYSLWKDKEQKK